MTPREVLREQIEHQDGLVTFAQLAAAGVTRAERRWRSDHGCPIVLPGVAAVFTGSLTARQQRIAALLYAGEGAALTGATAAAWHGVTAAGAVDVRVHVQVPEYRRARSCAFVTVHRTARPDPHLWHRPPLVIVGRPRAVIEAARSEPNEDACMAIILEAVERNLLTLSGLRHEIEAGARRGSAVVRRALAAAELGAWSVPEHDLARIVARSTVLPRMWANPRLRVPDSSPLSPDAGPGGVLTLPTPDGWFDDVGLAVQVHSRRFHSLGESWEQTVMDDGIYAEYGITLVSVTPSVLTKDPAAVLRRIERAHHAASLNTRPAVIATSRLVR